MEYAVETRTHKHLTLLYGQFMFSKAETLWWTLM